jgi:hypothetical protein
MHIIDLTPEEEARLQAIAVREGQDTATAATSYNWRPIASPSAE